MKKLYFQLLMIPILFASALVFFAPQNAFASFGSLNLTLAKQPLGQAAVPYSGVTVKVSSSHDNTWKWVSATYGCMGCRTCSIKGGVKAAGYDCDGSTWGAQKTGTSGSTYGTNNSNWIMNDTFACGQTECSSSTDKGQCNPFVAVITAPNTFAYGSWYYWNGSSYVAIGTAGSKTVTVNLTINNGSTKHAEYKFMEQPEPTHTVTTSFTTLGTNAAKTAVTASGASVTHAGNDGTGKINGQWFYKVGNGPAKPNWDGLSWIKGSARINPPLPATMPAMTPVTYDGTDKWYKVAFAVCDAGTGTQADCGWKDPGTETEFDLKTYFTEAGSSKPGTLNTVHRIYTTKEIHLGTTALTCTVEPQSGQAPMTVKVHAEYGGITTGYTYSMGDGTPALSGRPNEIFYTYGALTSDEITKYPDGRPTPITVTGPGTAGTCDASVTVKPPKDGSGGEVSWVETLRRLI